MARTESLLRRGTTIPPILAVLVVPLCVWAVELPTPPGGLGPLDAVQIDRYAFAKAMLVIALGAFGLIPGHKILKRLAPALMLVGLWLSTGLSHDVVRSLWGFPHHREGALVWTAYVGLFSAAVSVREPAARWIVDAAVAVSVVVCGLAFREFADKGIALSSLGHGNYLGGYLAMLLPLALDRACGTEAPARRWAYVVAAVIMAGGLFASQARGGMLAAALGIAVVAWARRADLRRFAQPLSAWFGGAAVVVGAMAPFASDQLYRKTTDGLLPTAFQELAVTSVDAVVTYQGSTLRMYQTGKDVIFTRGDGFPLALTRATDEWTFADPAASPFRVQPRNSSIGNLLVVKAGAFDLPFLVEPGRFGLVTVGEAFASEVPRLAFASTAYDSLLSGRVYLWNRTLPLLPPRLLVGAGPDHFPDEFPQRDFLGKLNVYQELRTFIDRPHSLYLAMLHAGGLPFLLGAAGLWLAALRGARRRRDAGLLAAVAAFLVQGLVNDSVIGVSAVFWVLAGLSARAHAGD